VKIDMFDETEPARRPFSGFASGCSPPDFAAPAPPLKSLAGVWGIVGDGVELAVHQVHAPQLFEVEGARAASAEDGELIAALVHGAVAVETFGDGDRRAGRLEGGDQFRIGARAEPA
jgi:hypothetical protein